MGLGISPGMIHLLKDAVIVRTGVADGALMKRAEISLGMGASAVEVEERKAWSQKCFKKVTI